MVEEVELVELKEADGGHSTCYIEVLDGGNGDGATA